MNVGSAADGVIPDVFKKRLRDVGTWLKINGECIYGTKPWRSQKDSLMSKLWYVLWHCCHCFNGVI